MVKAAVRRLQHSDELSELESLLAFFASFVLDTALVAQILRWDMVVLRESPWYQEILQEGERKGRQEGRQEGEIVVVIRQLRQKLGELAPSLIARIEALSLEQIEALSQALLGFVAIRDLESWLEAYC